MKLKIFTFLSLFITLSVFAQENRYWGISPDIKGANVRTRINYPTEFTLYQLNLGKLKKDLINAPQRFSSDENLVIAFPNPNGGFRNYIVQEASVMEEGLQAKFPNMRSYVGWEKENPLNTIRFSITPEVGLSVMYFDEWNVSYLDSYTQDNSVYIMYKRSNLVKGGPSFECLFKEDESNLAKQVEAQKAPLISDGKMRRYRLALAATGEYTVFHGGTTTGAMSAMVVTMTRVNGVFEKSASLTMVMVNNNNLLIYTNGATDPYANGNTGTMIDQNVTNVNAVIGSANYDIGHVFGTNSGGLAGLASVCGSRKAAGVTGSGSPINDPFDIDYVAHEMGHQFGATHTFRSNTGSCSGNASNATSFEPGGGTTIMAYAGICTPLNNIQGNSDPYFHAASILQIKNVIENASDCSVKVNNNNRTPTANAGNNYVIPKGTAFMLTAQGSDPDNDPLTYLWEQYNNENNTQPPVPTNTNGPVYRSQLPSSNKIRYFPTLPDVVANNLIPTWEVTPSVARSLKFSLLVSDNKATGNQSAQDEMEITVANQGPFKVTSHTTNTEHDSAFPTKITWNVAGTNMGAINTTKVDVLISKDGGQTFTMLKSNLPNNGSAQVQLPNENIAAARIMIKAVDNIFFAVNSSPFSIKSHVGIAAPIGLPPSQYDTMDFMIYPNPAKGEVFVNLKNDMDLAYYTLYDMSGRFIRKGSIGGKNARISLDGISTGDYIIQIKVNHDKVFTETLMIK